jgi:hypothetical protein
VKLVLSTATMDDDLFIDRLRRKERFRQMEEERRQRMLEESKYVTSHGDHAVLVDAPKDAKGTRIPSKSEKIASFDAYPSSVLKHYSYSKPNSGIPGDVGYLNMKSSPLSSVSMSQTPEKARANRQEPKVARRLDSDRSLSSFEDRDLDDKPLVKSAQALPTLATKTATTVSGKRKLCFNDSDTESEGEDLVLLVQRKENPNYVPPTEPVVSKEDAKVTSSNTAAKTPRNPLILMKQEYDMESVRKMSPASLRRSSGSNQHLWSDSEDEKDRPSKFTSRGSSRSKGGLGQKRDSTMGALETFTSTYKSDDNLGSKEKPIFDRPKFGPFVASPFILRSIDESDETYEVPASICRYLPDYQREGIEFMYRCGICTKRGAILGDGRLDVLLDCLIKPFALLFRLLTLGKFE